MVQLKNYYLILVIFLFVLKANGRVNYPPKITTQPKDTFFEVTNNRNDIEKPFFIECEAEGFPLPSYRWTKNGRDVMADNNDRILQESGSLFIANPNNDDMGYYQCFAQNKLGIAMSNSIFVGKAFLNSFSNANIKSLVAEEGKPCKLKCQEPLGYPKPKIHWVLGTNYLTSINNSHMTIDPDGNLWFSYVTFDDGKVFYTCIVKSPIINEYQMGEKIKLTVLPRPVTSNYVIEDISKLYTTKKHENVIYGEDIELFCIYGGTIIHEIKWFKNGEILNSDNDDDDDDDVDNGDDDDDNDDDDRIEIRNYGKSILIKKTIFDDGGLYTCEISDRFENLTSFTINLKVLAIPTFTIEPKDKNVTTDETIVTIRCEATGIPDPIIQWYYNGKPIEKAPRNDRRIYSRNIVQIHNIVETDTGNYGCNASNSLGYVYKDVYLNVLAFAPEVSETQQISAIVGHSVNITCNIIGMPKPLIKWYRKDVELIGYRYIKLDYDLLQITNLGFNDTGNYSCIGKNKYGQVNSVIPLTVKNKTEIIQFQHEYKIETGAPVTLICDYRCDDSLNLTIEWKINSTLFVFDESYRFSILPDNSFSISKTVVTDTGSYTCIAKTELDEVSYTSELIVQDVPNAPELTGIQCHAHDATILWNSQFDNNSPITNYTIEYNTTFTPNTWSISVENISAIDFSYTVAMSPWANYSFRVIAFNDIGPSIPSLNSYVCTTQPTVPRKNPDNVEGKGTEPHNLVITWTAMPQIDQNGPGFHYLISYKRDHGLEPYHVKKIYNWTQTRLVIRDKPIYQKYTIKVVAVNNLGEANVAPREVIGYSGEDRPLNAPENVCLVQLTGITSAIIQWDPIEIPTVRGNFKGYKIEVWSADEGELGIHEFYVDQNTKITEIKKLKSNTLNFVQVFVYNGKYYGPGSRIIKFLTPEGVPDVVQSFKVTANNVTSGLKLKWKEPLKTNGNITGYNIYYQMIRGIKIGEKQKLNPQITDPNINEITINGLKPDQTYRIYIAATTRVGEGSVFFIDRMTEPLPELIPDIPKFTLERGRNEFGYATIKVKWINALDQNSGSYLYTKYKKVNTDVWHKSERIYIYDEILIDSLELRSKYEFRVYAVNNNIESKSVLQQMDLSLIAEPRLHFYNPHKVNNEQETIGFEATNRGNIELYLQNKDAMCSTI